MDPILGSIIIFAGNFAPKPWAFCQGQLLSIAQNSALFAILGTTYGGDGQTTFALPDLRGRVAVSQGQGPGLSNYFLGQQAGTENVTLNVSQMPSHSHNVAANDSTANATVSPKNAYLSQTNVPGTRPTTSDTYASSLATATTLNPATIQSQGGSLPHTNIQPLLAINYIIALQGIFPSRD